MPLCVFYISFSLSFSVVVMIIMHSLIIVVVSGVGLSPILSCDFLTILLACVLNTRYCKLLLNTLVLLRLFTLAIQGFSQHLLARFFTDCYTLWRNASVISCMISAYIMSWLILLPSYKFSGCIQCVV